MKSAKRTKAFDTKGSYLSAPYGVELLSHSGSSGRSTRSATTNDRIDLGSKKSYSSARTGPFTAEAEYSRILTSRYGRPYHRYKTNEATAKEDTNVHNEMVGTTN